MEHDAPVTDNRMTALERLKPLYVIDRAQLRVYWRLPWYCVAGAILIWLIPTLLPTVLPTQLHGHWHSSVLLLVFAACLLYGAWHASRQALRIDHVGLWRRHAWTWHLWSWDDIQQGNITRSSSDAIEDLRRPWWRNTLSLSYLPDKDANAIRREIFNQMRRLPTEVTPVEAQVVDHRLRSIRITKEGMVLEHTDTTKVKHHGWEQVTFHVLKLHHDSSFCGRLRIHVDGEKKPRQILLDANLRWRNVSRRQLLTILEQYVPKDRLQIDSVNDLPRDVSEADRRIAELQRRRREARHGVRIMQVIVLVMCGTLAVSIVTSARPFDVIWVWIKFFVDPLLCVLLLALPYAVYRVTDQKSLVELKELQDHRELLQSRT